MKEKASGRAHIVRWTMVLRRPKRSVDCAAHREKMYPPGIPGCYAARQRKHPPGIPECHAAKQRKHPPGIPGCHAAKQRKLLPQPARAWNKSCAVKVAARGMWEAYFYDIKCEVSLHLCSPSVIFLSIVPQTFKICCAEVQNQFMTSYIVFPE